MQGPRLRERFLDKAERCGYNKSIKSMGVCAVPTEEDYKVIEKSTIYDLRRIFSSGEKDTYTRQEIVELLDKIADAKDQE